VKPTNARLSAIALALLTAIAAAATAPALADGGDHRARMLGLFDTNEDGAIDRAEFMAGHDERYARMDADGDGAVTQAEFDEAVMRFRAEHGIDAGGRHRGPDFRRFDVNGDGGVTRAEFDEAAERMFGHLDRNGDGVLSPEDREVRNEG
jgi:Ca2+-binding EF-hand superfamily protein